MEANVHPDLELEAELKELMTALAEAGLESEAEWEAAGGPSCPSPMQVTVARFPRYAEAVASLPPTEQRKVREIVGVILGSHRPGCKPVLQVDLVGHADRDYQRGPAFEQRMSTRRALALLRALQQLIGSEAISSSIAWQARGVGARKLLVNNPRNESDRARNRRVDVVLSAQISANYPILIKDPVVGYTWAVSGLVPGLPTVEGAEYELTFPTPTPVFDSLQVPYKWICSLTVDFGPEVLPGPIVTGRRIFARATGTLISGRHALTATCTSHPRPVNKRSLWERR
jgi:outer membrane protein OmpA-like peptidoglycan-associated protein